MSESLIVYDVKISIVPRISGAKTPECTDLDKHVLEEILHPSYQEIGPLNLCTIIYHMSSLWCQFCGGSVCDIFPKPEESHWIASNQLKSSLSPWMCLSMSLLMNPQPVGHHLKSLKHIHTNIQTVFYSDRITSIHTQGSKTRKNVLSPNRESSNCFAPTTIKQHNKHPKGATVILVRSKGLPIITDAHWGGMWQLGYSLSRWWIWLQTVGCSL